MCHRSSVHRVLSVGLGMVATLTLARLTKLLSLDQHVVWISVAFLPSKAQPSKSCPVILFPAVHRFDQLEIDASPRLFDHHLELLEEFRAEEEEPLKPPEIGED